jgi:hypothetical protein
VLLLRNSMAVVSMVTSNICAVTFFSTLAAILIFTVPERVVS